MKEENQAMNLWFGCGSFGFQSQFWSLCGNLNVGNLQGQLKGQKESLQHVKLKNVHRIYVICFP